MKVTNRLRVFRAERRWSQLETARRTRGKVSTTRIWKIENGYTHATPDEQERLAKLFGVAIEAIFPPPIEREQMVS